MTDVKSKAFQHGKKSMISITVDTDQVVSLDAMAAVRRTSRAALIREAIDLYLTKKAANEQVAA